MIFTVDPGITGTGIAMWEFVPTQWRLHRTITLTSKRKDWLARCEDIAGQFKNWLRTTCDEVHCEAPQFFESAKGQVAASTQSLVKLVHLVGMLHAETLERDVPFHMVPLTWKGQLPKKVTQKRVLECTGKDFPEHENDAVAIGLFLQKRAFVEKR